MSRLKFVPGEVEGTQSALGMFAKDGEYVEFNHDCDCSGPVTRLQQANRFSMALVVEKYLENIQEHILEIVDYCYIDLFKKKVL